MIAPPDCTRVWLATGLSDMRRGMDGLAALLQSALGRDPFSGHIFLFRERRGDLIKILWPSGEGMNLYLGRTHERIAGISSVFSDLSYFPGIQLDARLASVHTFGYDVRNPRERHSAR
ncbi:IS66 family insertion sequence element accessory protein TnpB [Burkholderia sp. MSMB1078WGS]|uniref:IS66 family insertion sequence element accessory protein TnpB n=1 Tax=Burkholderia sp. MSMB1078WGS TaxID=1637900 RepID=UPI0009E67E2E|nr:IS66 family insertion sequence element accessory protein TnpB [Burkholderia sp. MSMB1078WGS]